MAKKPKNKRRDFLQLSTVTLGAVGTAAFIWPFLKSMSPAEDTLAAGSTEVDISAIEEGQSITIKWRGKPVFIKKNCFYIKNFFITFNFFLKTKVIFNFKNFLF